jgi:tripartite-type tricarboxylate transporter receptor subunit TctC
MHRNLLSASIAILLGLTTAVSSATAQTWPTRPVRVIVSFPAGGGTDATARAYAEKLSQTLGQQFVVDNRAGASGVIGHDVCAKAAPDGYTLCVATLGGIGLLPQVRKTPYDPIKDFTPIGRVTDALFGFAVHPSSPWTTMQEFADDARKKPDTFTLANSGVATITHLAGETMAASFGIRLVMVPYKGGVEQLQDALAGHVSMMYEGNFFPHVKAGKLRGLAVSTPFRHPNFPDIPSMKEILPDWDMPSWFAFMGPAGLPPVVAEKLSPLLNQISDMKDVQERVLAMGLVTVKDTPQGLAADLTKQTARFAEAVKRLNIKAE